MIKTQLTISYEYEEEIPTTQCDKQVMADVIDNADPQKYLEHLVDMIASKRIKCRISKVSVS